MHKNAYFLVKFCKIFPGACPRTPRMVVPSALPSKLIFDVTRLWRNLPPLGNFLRTSLQILHAALSRSYQAVVFFIFYGKVHKFSSCLAFLGKLSRVWPAEVIISSSRDQGRNEVKRRPGQKANLAPQYSNLRSFGSNSTLLKKVIVTLLGLFGSSRSHSSHPRVIQRPGNGAPLAHPRYAPARDRQSAWADKKFFFRQTLYHQERKVSSCVTDCTRSWTDESCWQCNCNKSKSKCPAALLHLRSVTWKTCLLLNNFLFASSVVRS